MRYNDLTRFVICDFEYTAWEGSRDRMWSEHWESRELVEIGAVLICANNGQLELMGRFSKLLRPTKNPLLSDYFTELTGIRQADIDERGVGLQDGICQFANFIGKPSTVLSYGEDLAILRENLGFLGKKNARFSEIFWIDYKKDFTTCMGISPTVASSGLPAELNLKTPSLAKHRALDDCVAQFHALSLAIQGSFGELITNPVSVE